MTNLTNRYSYVHKARKSDNYKSDEEDKQNFINLMWDCFRIACIRGDAFMGFDGKTVLPDVKTTNYSPETYFELDGEYHGSGDDVSTTDKTWRRNARYDKAALRMIAINKADTNGYEPKKVLKILAMNGFHQ